MINKQEQQEPLFLLTNSTKQEFTKQRQKNQNKNSKRTERSLSSQQDPPSNYVY